MGIENKTWTTQEIEKLFSYAMNLAENEARREIKAYSKDSYVAAGIDEAFEFAEESLVWAIDDMKEGKWKP